MMTQNQRRQYNAFLTAEWRETLVIDTAADAIEDQESPAGGYDESDETTEDILRNWPERYSDW